MVAERIGEDEELHDKVARGEKAEHEQADAVQREAENGERDVAERRERGDDEHAHNTGQLARDLQQAALNGIDLKNILEVVGDDGAAQAVGEREKKKGGEKKPPGSLFIHA